MTTSYIYLDHIYACSFFHMGFLARDLGGGVCGAILYFSQDRVHVVRWKFLYRKMLWIISRDTSPPFSSSNHQIPFRNLDKVDKAFYSFCNIESFERVEKLMEGELSPRFFPMHARWFAWPRPFVRGLSFKDPPEPGWAVSGHVNRAIYSPTTCRAGQQPQQGLHGYNRTGA